jgi:predicted nucleotidyltransferase
MSDEDGFVAFTPGNKEVDTIQKRSSFGTLEDVDDGNVFGKKRKSSGSEPVFMNSFTPLWLDQKSKNTLERKAPPLVRLHNEILTFCEFISPTPAELAMREKVLNEAKRVILSLWPTASVRVFGSQLTTILVPSSDIDIAVLNVPLEENQSVSDLILQLTEHIRKEIKVTYLEAVTSARVPIIKYDHEESKIGVDICINHDSGLQTGEFIVEKMKTFPPFKPLALVLKTFLTQRKFNDTYTGGIGSFLLSCMILSFLQHKQKTSFFSDFYPSWNLGTLLLEFLQLYGITFNYFMTGVSVQEDGCYFPKFSFNNDSYTSSLKKGGGKKKRKNMKTMKSQKKRKLDAIEGSEEEENVGNNEKSSDKSSGRKEEPGKER